MKPYTGVRVHGPAKYHNRRTVTADGTFDSLGEESRWRELKLLERAGEISQLERQIAYELIPTLRVPGQRTEPAIVYWADFRYHEHGQTIVEDWKGFETEGWRLKRRLFLHQYSHLTLRVTGRGRR